MCYVETHDEEYIGHFRLGRIDFRSDGIFIEIDRSSNREIHVKFSLPITEFEKTLLVIKILSGEMGDDE